MRPVLSDTDHKNQVYTQIFLLNTLINTLWPVPYIKKNHEKYLAVRWQKGNDLKDIIIPFPFNTQIYYKPC